MASAPSWTPLPRASAPLAALILAFLLALPAARAEAQEGQGGADDAALSDILAVERPGAAAHDDADDEDHDHEGVDALLARVQRELTRDPAASDAPPEPPPELPGDAQLAERRAVRRVSRDPEAVPDDAPAPPEAAEGVVAGAAPSPDAADAAPADAPPPVRKLVYKPFKFQMPVKHVRVTSKYGIRKDPKNRRKKKMHRGVDFGGAIGTPVLATGPAKVLHAGWGARGVGICVILEHPDGWVSMYFHLSKVEVNAGEVIDAGETVGQIGSTGRSTGPHLHFQLVKKGQAYDPQQLLGKWSNKVK
jgi:murein DD-endopeptidase MepM/ murein hydrolase activator NlpD